MSSLNQGNNCCAVIPFFNEKKYLESVVRNTLRYVDKIFAVDDGSADGSANDIAGIENVEIISLDKNYGKGFALQAGFNEAINCECEIIITLDGDNQHDPDLIPVFIEGLKKYDIIIGNRLNNLKSMPIQRILSNKITSFLLSLRTGESILDSQCGFRAYRASVLKNIKTTFYGYEAESEMILLAAKKKFSIGFEDISTIYRDEESRMNSLKAINGFIKVYLKNFSN
ncbi:MAG: glycosyltransferase family 2 protein [Ignavibacteriaceae bacterium]|nr:glycosyltransferase family 2 protein [Ignavibacteriaceae bacterium]